MQIYKPLTQLPVDVQLDWMASLHPATPTPRGAFRLVAARRTDAKGFQSQRITVLVVDENGFPMPNIRVAFAYSTAPDYHTITPDFLWTPPEQRAFIVPTGGGGTIDQIQGDAVKAGQPGGITVFIWEPEYSSDAVRGAGMLGDHTGLHLVFQLLRVGIVPLSEWLARMEADIAELKTHILTPLEPVKMAAPGNEWPAVIERRLALLETIVNAR